MASLGSEWFSETAAEVNAGGNHVAACHRFDRNRTLASALSVVLLLLVLTLAGCRTAPPEASRYFPAADVVNYSSLVSAKWVKALLEFERSNGVSPRPPTYHNDRFVILEASWAPLEKAEDYLRGHIPGAIHLNTDDLENGYPQWRLRTPEELRDVLGQHGITSRTTVIVYGRQLIAAARVWWVLKYLGVDDVRLLDGGFEMWESLGYPMETEIQFPLPGEFDGVVKSNILATTDYVRSRLEDRQVWMADARSEAEFKGRKSGYDYLDCRGRVPNAVAIGDVTDDSPLYTRSRGRLREPSEIERIWRDQGIVSSLNPTLFDREVVFYCGGGWRSSLAFFYAHLLGYENIRNYSDGWSGWSTEYVPDPAAEGSTPGWRQERTENPISTGAD